MRALAVLLLAVALVPAAAGAAPLKPWIEATGSWGTYSMGDVNDFVGLINSDIGAAGLKMDEINNGFGFGGRFGIELTPTMAVGVGYERLTASTDVGNALGSLTFAHPANTFNAFFEYQLPVQGPVGLALGVSAGLVSESGKLEETVTGDGTAKLDLSGSGGLFQGYLSGTFWATHQFGIAPALGYRFATVNQVKGEFQGVSSTLKNQDSSNMAVDYSGVFLRLGLRYAFTK